MNIKDVEKYSTLIKKLDVALDGEEIDDVIPALVSFLAMAGSFGGIDKKILLAYFADRMDEIYSEQERRAC